MEIVIAKFLAVVVRTALLGALIGWLLRKARPMSITASYAIGTAVAAVGALAFERLALERPEPLSLAVAFALFGGLLGFAILYATSRRARRESDAA